MAVLEATALRTTAIRGLSPVEQTFWLLRAGFSAAPLLFGIDKFTKVLVDWPIYLAPWVNDLLPGSANDFMMFVGVVEIAAGLLVLFRPTLGAMVVAGWLAGIIVNLLSIPGYYDIALRDFGLLLGALSLARLSLHRDRVGAL